MTRTLVFAAAIAAAGILLEARTQQPQTFRAGADAVIVDVSVREGGRAVTGLRTEDFTVTDNGVRQRVESVEAGSVPIDLTLVLDVSGNARRTWRARTTLSRLTADIEADVSEVAAMLRPEDRLRLITIGTDVREIWPMRGAAASRRVSGVEADGKAALYDGLVAALLYAPEPGRRHVVVARVKGIDTMSSVQADAVRAVAERSDALLYIASKEDDLETDDGAAGFQCAFMGYCWRTHRFWTPFERRLFNPWAREPGLMHELGPDGQAISSGAEATGGGLLRAGAFSTPGLMGAFRKAFDDFRSSYVLRYVPDGVRKPGWHAIEVRVAGRRSDAVRSRQGYLVEESESPQPPPSVPGLPRTLDQFVAAYDRGGYAQVVAGLRQISDPERLIRDFEDGGNPWPANPRLEAALAVELAEPAVFSPRQSAREAADALLARFSRLIRHPIEPDVFERYWYFTVLAQLEGSLRPGVTEAFAAAALARFPDEPRFVLSRAIATDQSSATRDRGATGDAKGTPTPAHIDAVIARYRAAITFPETSAEARIRLAWFLSRLDRHGEALQQLTAAAQGPIGEPALRYLRLLFLGHVLTALGRNDDAAAAFRAALSEMASVQSARVALMNTMLLSGDRLGAEKLANEIQLETTFAVDPLWVYWQGQYRFYAQAMARLRELSR